ncbi:MAG: TonB-dependent receptor [Bacteroidetes bacterium QS_8_68_15]|nr:MAG: TonB-dependent receptor [Bacteroidetes bacterium QS_8_68_15]
MRLTAAALFGAALLFLCLPAPDARAQAGGDGNWSTVEGRVTSAADTSTGISSATVLVAGTNYGTSADAEGRYRMRLPAGAYLLRFSSVGFETRTDSVSLRAGQTVRRDARLAPAVEEMAVAEVTADREETPGAGVYEIEGAHAETMPTPLPDGFRTLKTLPGVATQNELSSQYSVRGGGYNENLIFINGFQVYMPFRPRQGEQEGLGLWNPQLTESARLYAGGFPVRYGGKLSSALEVEYREPEGPVSGQGAASTMDLSGSAGASALGGNLSWLVGVRRARAGRLFGTQELQGDYTPDYADGQATLSYQIADGHQLEALGLWANYDYSLDPQAKQTYFGTISMGRGPSNLQSLFTEYEGQETAGYSTGFGGLRLTDRLSGNVRAEHEAAYYRTTETEHVDVRGSSVLTRIDPASGKSLGVLGVGEQHNTADNRVAVSTLTGRGRYYSRGASRHAPEVGWHVRRLAFDDEIDERTTQTNARTDEESLIRQINGTAELGTWQAGAYAQDVIDLLEERDRLLLTAGVRTDYYAFSEELTVSPRLSARFEWTDQTTLNAAAGVYHQKPTYRELRGRPPTEEALDDAGGRIEETLNRDLDSQRSLQFILGGERFFPDRRLYLRAEAYYSRLSNLVSYEIDNVRVEYSGRNDTRGYTYGLDLQLRGEFVPGLESWFNYSYLVSKEDFYDEFEGAEGYRSGWLPRPADQRHTFSAFVQDYIPGDKTWKLHLRALFGSGLPYTPPVPGRRVADGVQAQKPGPRNNARYPEYRRVDAGATKIIRLFDQAVDGPMTMTLTAEVLNLFDMTNTVAYNWDANFNRIPTHLTPRALNVRMRLKF